MPHAFIEVHATDGVRLLGQESCQYGVMTLTGAGLAVDVEFECDMGEFSSLVESLGKDVMLIATDMSILAAKAPDYPVPDEVLAKEIEPEVKELEEARKEAEPEPEVKPPEPEPEPVKAEAPPPPEPTPKPEPEAPKAQPRQCVRCGLGMDLDGSGNCPVCVDMSDVKVATLREAATQEDPDPPEAVIAAQRAAEQLPEVSSPIPKEDWDPNRPGQPKLVDRDMESVEYPVEISAAGKRKVRCVFCGKMASITKVSKVTQTHYEAGDSGMKCKGSKMSEDRLRAAFYSKLEAQAILDGKVPYVVKQLEEIKKEREEEKQRHEADPDIRSDFGDPTPEQEAEYDFNGMKTGQYVWAALPDGGKVAGQAVRLHPATGEVELQDFTGEPVMVAAEYTKNRNVTLISGENGTVSDLLNDYADFAEAKSRRPSWVYIFDVLSDLYQINELETTDEGWFILKKDHMLEAVERSPAIMS
jgi:ferredoxin